MADKKSFIIYFNWAQMLRDMPDQEAGQLIKGISSYELGEDVNFDNPLLAAVFSMMKDRLDEDSERYKEKVKKFEENKRKWKEEQEAQKSNRNLSEIYQKSNRNLSEIYGDTVTDTVTDNDNDTDTVNVTDTVTDTSVTNVTNNTNKIRSPAEPDITEEIVNYLNQKLGTRYKADTEKTRRLIRARIREGATLEDFEKVIDKKVREWRGTKYEPYLRPETLFGTKFEGYLNQGAAGTRSAAKGSFGDFEQRGYDFEALEKALEE